VNQLPSLLAQTPATRPPRVPPWAPITQFHTGNDPDASGWVADGYHVIDYGGTLERSLWQAEHDQTLFRLLLQRWHGYVFPCATVSCSGSAPRLPPPSAWHPSTNVRTVSYGNGKIIYDVHLSQPALMVENELSVRGWHTNTTRAHLVQSALPLRTWRLAPGAYRFTAAYQESGRPIQYSAVAIALLAWLGCFLVLRRSARHLG